LPISYHLFWGGYTYGKLLGYYNRSLANYETLATAQKEYDRGLMIALSVTLERSVRAMKCPPEVKEALNGLESELSARGTPRESRLTEIDTFVQCAETYPAALQQYWWTGRSVGRLSFLFENLERPEIDLLPNSSDHVLLEELKYLGTNSVLLRGTPGFPRQAETLLKELEDIRVANAQNRELP